MKKQNIYNQIEDEIKAARKSGQTKLVTTLSMVLGEIQRNPNVKIVDGNKNYDNDVCISVLKSLQKNWLSTLEILVDSDNRRESLLAELQIISSFLPKQLTEDQLVEIKNNTNPENLGHWMKFLKENYSGQYDGSLAKRVFER